MDILIRGHIFFISNLFLIYDWLDKIVIDINIK